MHSTIEPRRQRAPDWSPRGDWVAYQEWRQSRPWPDIHQFNLSSSEELLLTPGIEGVDESPAFSPNGQHVAYIIHFVGASGDPDSIWQLRRIGLSGTDDVTLVQSAATRALRSPRWSPDGQWVLFTAGDSLYAVGVEGANQGLVVDRTAVLDHAPSFDLHRGHGPIVFEQADSVTYLFSCKQFTSPPFVLGWAASTPLTRVALRDTFQRLPLPQFDQRLVAHMCPRSSFDGTRIAYVYGRGGARFRTRYLRRSGVVEPRPDLHRRSARHGGAARVHAELHPGLHRH